MAYAGLLGLDGEEKPIRAEVEFTGEDLVIAVASGPLGAWALTACRIEPRGDRFLIDVDGDVAWFRPDDAAAFARDTLAHQRSGGLASAVRTARLASAPPLVEVTPSSADPDAATPLSRWAALSPGQKNLALAGGAVVVALMALAMLAGGPSPLPTVIPTPLVTTVTTTPTFELNLAELSMRWNEVAAELRLEMFVLGVPKGNRMEVDLGRGVILYATADPRSDRVRTLMIGAGPGEGDHAKAVLGAWGTLVALVNPELSPEGRRQVLDRLGVDVERPLQLGLATETDEGGMHYWFRSGVLGGRTLLGVEVLS